MKILAFVPIVMFFYNTFSQTSTFAEKQAFESFSYSSAKSDRIPSFHTKESTKGSQFLFNDWVVGTAVNKDGQSVVNSVLKFNYDKLHNSLYMISENGTIYLINLQDVSSITFNQSQTVKLEYLPNISKTELVQLIDANSAGYKLYKTLKTKYVPSNYVSTGLTESGHNYDEYVDQPEYFLFKDKEGYTKLPIKLKELKEIFKEKSLVINYLKTHKNDTIDDNFMKSILSYLN